MITIGVDAHKRVHVALALDEFGREVGHWRGANSAAGWQDFYRWATEIGTDLKVGIEGAWGYGRGLAQHLIAHGVAVYEVNSRWTAIGRRSSRKPDKTDRLDARAVALFVHREGVGLPQVAADDETAILNLLTTEREAAIGEATRLRNQIHAILMQLDPQYQLDMPTMKTQAGLARLRACTPSDERPLSVERAAAVRRLTERLELALTQADALAVRIRAEATTRFAPLMRLCGVNALTAGVLAGILGPGRRFASDAALAAYAGASPVEASSAGHVRHRLNRGGNRRLNAILYMIALSQARHSEQARTYLARRTSEGKTKREAMRALKRFRCARSGNSGRSAISNRWRLPSLPPRSRLHIGASTRGCSLAVNLAPLPRAVKHACNRDG